MARPYTCCQVCDTGVYVPAPEPHHNSVLYCDTCYDRRLIQRDLAAQPRITRLTIYEVVSSSDHPPHDVHRLALKLKKADAEEIARSFNRSHSWDTAYVVRLEVD